MRGIVIAGGEGPTPEVLKKIAAGADIVAAADSGVAAAENAELKADWVLGDMDSLDKISRLEKYPSDRILRFPPDKDFTDTELAMTLLREKGCDEIWISGGGGGRIDHLLAIRSLFEREYPPDRWFPGDWEILCLREGRFLNSLLPRGSLVSVFPLRHGPWEAESTGLKWPLNGIKWESGSFGISNVAFQGPFEIRSIRGRFMVIMPVIFNG